MKGFSKSDRLEARAQKVLANPVRDFSNSFFAKILPNLRFRLESRQRKNPECQILFRKSRLRVPRSYTNSGMQIRLNKPWYWMKTPSYRFIISTNYVGADLEEEIVFRESIEDLTRTPPCKLDWIILDIATRRRTNSPSCIPLNGLYLRNGCP